MKSLEQLAREAGMVDQLNQGAASCVYSHGCNGVTQEHLERFRAACRAEALEEAAQRCEQIKTAPLACSSVSSREHVGLCAAAIREMK